MVNIPAGKIIASLNFNLKDDNIVECNEAFYFHIHVPSLYHDDVVSVHPFNATVIIVDDEKSKINIYVRMFMYIHICKQICSHILF